MARRDRLALILAMSCFWIANGIYFPIFPLYLHTTRGISVGDIGTLIAFYWILVTALQVPTGIFSDRFGRKRAFLIASAATASAMWFGASVAAFSLFLVQQALLAVGRAFFDGSLHAWAVERLKARDAVHLTWVAKVEHQAIGVGVIIGGLVSSLIMLRSADYTEPLWWAGAMLAIGGFLGAWLIHEAPSGAPLTSADERSFAGLAKTAIATLRASPMLRNLMYFVLAYWFSVSALWFYWPIYFEPLIGSKSFAGYFTAIFGVATVIGIVIAYRATRRGSNGLVVLRNATIIGGLGYLAIAIGAGTIAVPFAGLLIAYAAFGVFQTCRERYLNAYAPDAVRSTILSCASSSAAVGVALGHFIWSRSIEHFSFFWTWLASSAFFLIVLQLIISRIRKREAQSEPPPR